MSKEVKIIPFSSQYSTDFKLLNIEWLEKYFVVEPHDAELLEKSQENIIDKGGFIFLAKLNNKIVGTVALIKINSQNFELGKMAVSPKVQGLGIGQQLMQYSIDFGKSQHWSNLILYSNTVLENAIYIYRKYGFIEVPIEKDTPYARGNIKMVLKL